MNEENEPLPIMSDDEIIAVVSARRHGKMIERCVRHKRVRPWVLDESCEWDFEYYHYRIARDPRKCWVRWSKETGRPELFHAHKLTSAEGWQLVTEQL